MPLPACLPESMPCPYRWSMPCAALKSACPTWRSPSAIAEGTGSPQAVGTFVNGEFERWGKIVKSIGIQPE